MRPHRKDGASAGLSLVGKAGFEPAASASRTLRANQAALLPVLSILVDRYSHRCR